MTLFDAPPQVRRTFLRDGLSVLGTKAVVIPTGVVTGVLTARFLGVEGKGALTALTVVPSLVIALAEGGIRQSAIYLLGQARHPERRVAGTTYWLLGGSAVVGVALALGMYAVQGRPLLDIAVLLGLSLVPLKLCQAYAGGLLLGQDRIVAFNRLRWLPNILTLAAVLALLGWLRLGLPGAVGTLVAGALPVALYATWLVVRDPGLDARFSAPVARQLVRRGVVYALSLFVLQLNYRLDFLLLERWSTTEQLGQYAVGVHLAELLLELPLAFGLVVFVRRARSGDADAFGLKVARVVRSSVVLVALGALGLGATAPALLPLIYGPEFAESARVTQLLLPGVIVLAIFKILNLDMAGRGRPEVALWVMLGGLAVNVTLNAALIPTHGARGAAVASSISYSLATAVFVVVYGRLSGLATRTLLAFERADLRPLMRVLRRQM